MAAVAFLKSVINFLTNPPVFISTVAVLVSLFFAGLLALAAWARNPTCVERPVALWWSAKAAKGSSWGE